MASRGLGIAQHVLQLRKLTLTFCRHGGSSRGMREYIEIDLVTFAKENPSVVVHAALRSNRHPTLFGEYLNGQMRVVGVKNLSAKEIGEHVAKLRNISGTRVAKIGKWTKTTNPSLQGNWNPFANSPQQQAQTITRL